MSEHRAGDPRPGARQRLFAVAYRLLGSAHDAEDAVQETFVRWEQLAASDREAIREPAAWLTTVLGRICLDQLGSARSRHERYAGFWLPEPLPGRVDRLAVGPLPAPDPADTITFEESVSMALLVVMESLTPAERVSFILHDVFRLPFAEIARTVGRTPHACRQLAAAARKRVSEHRRYAVEGPERTKLIEAFSRACEQGDMEALLGVLDPRVVARSDGGGQVTAALRPVAGASAVARFLLGILAKAKGPDPGPPVTELELDLAPVNGQTGIRVRIDGDPVGVVGLAVAGNRIAIIDIVVNPDKLTSWK